MWRVAGAFARSGMFKDATQAEQAFAKIMIGRDLGLSPAQSMMGIHIVEGKPEVAAVTLASFVQKHPAGYSYRIIEHTDEACEIEFRKGDDVLGTSRFTALDAARAGLTAQTRNGKDSNHTKFPRNMTFARAMSNGVKWYCPEVMGGVPVYHEGEIAPAIEAPVEEPQGVIPAGESMGAALPEGDPQPDIPDGFGDPEPEDAEVVAHETLLPADEQSALVDSFTEAGFDDMTMFLSAVGIDSPQDITEAHALELRRLLGAELAKAATEVKA